MKVMHVIYSSRATSRVVKRLVANGELMALGPGCYIDVGFSKLKPHEAYPLRVLADAHGIRSDRVLSHASAAAMYGFGKQAVWTVNADRRTVYYTVPDRSGLEPHPGRVVHVAPLPKEHLRRVRNGPLVTSRVRTAVDLARAGTFLQGVVALESVLRNTDRGEVVRCMEVLAGRAGLPAARAALEFAGALSESPLESWSRVELAADPTLPTPIQQQLLITYDSAILRPDFVWNGSRGCLIGECDGRSKYAVNPDLWAEKEREDLLRGYGFGFLRWYMDDLRNPGQLARRVGTALHNLDIGEPRPLPPHLRLPHPGELAIPVR